MISVSVVYKNPEDKDKNHAFSYNKLSQLQQEITDLLYIIGYKFDHNFKLKLPNEDNIVVKYETKEAVIEMKWINNRIYLDTGTSFVL
jgi:hypothetical protein